MKGIGLDFDGVKGAPVPLGEGAEPLGLGAPEGAAVPAPIGNGAAAGEE